MCVVTSVVRSPVGSRPRWTRLCAEAVARPQASSTMTQAALMAKVKLRTLAHRTTRVDG